MNAKKSSNPVRPTSIAKWTLIALLFGGVGLQIVYLKNQQFQLGQKIRQTEQTIRKTYLDNQVLLAEIVTLSSRAALQKKLLAQATVMTPIENQYITRFSISGVTQLEVTQQARNVFQTASNERFMQ